MKHTETTGKTVENRQETNLPEGAPLYAEMTVRQNLVLHTRLYHLAPDKAKARVPVSWSRIS